MGPTTLETLGRAIGVPRSRLVELNPALIRSATPAGPSVSRVPIGKEETPAAKLKDIRPEPSRTHIVHVVNNGDNLPKILRRYGIRKSQLAGLNPDVNLRHRLRRGQRIVVPAEAAETTKRQVRRGKRVSWLREGLE